MINGTYQPLARPIFIYVNAKAYERPEVKQFVEFYMKNAERLVQEVKYVPLPPRPTPTTSSTWRSKQLGHQVRRREQGRPDDRRTDEARSEALIEIRVSAGLVKREGLGAPLAFVEPGVVAARCS